MRKYLLGAAILPALLGSATADTYQATNWMAPAHILNEYPYQQFAKDVAAASDGAIEFEVYSSGALVPAPTTMQGIGDSVAQLGIVYPPYNPSELPLNNAVNDQAFTARDSTAAAFAYTELGLTNARVQAEWNENGGLFLGGYATPFYTLICMSDIVSPQDVSGKKVRVAGTAQTAWIQSLGGVPVSVPIGDVYSGMERGSIDCTMSDATNLDKGNKFWEIAKTVNTLPQGVVLGATYVVGTDFWAGLEPAERRVLLDNMAVGLARSQAAYNVGVAAALEGSKERGLKVSEPTQEMTDTLAAFQSKIAAELPAKSMAERKIEDPTEVLKQFVALEDKWIDLLKDVNKDDPEALAAVLKANLYDGIDETTFGTN